jgi:hypothetical protein
METAVIISLVVSRTRRPRLIVGMKVDRGSREYTGGSKEFPKTGRLGTGRLARAKIESHAKQATYLGVLITADQATKQRERGR